MTGLPNNFSCFMVLHSPKRSPTLTWKQKTQLRYWEALHRIQKWLKVLYLRSQAGFKGPSLAYSKHPESKAAMVEFEKYGKLMSRYIFNETLHFRKWGINGYAGGWAKLQRLIWSKVKRRMQLIRLYAVVVAMYLWQPGWVLFKFRLVWLLRRSWLIVTSIPVDFYVNLGLLLLQYSLIGPRSQSSHVVHHVS